MTRSWNEDVHGSDEDPTWGEQLRDHAELSTSAPRFLRGMTLWSEGAVGEVRVWADRDLGIFSADVTGTHRYGCVVAFPLLDEWEREVAEAVAALRPPDVPRQTFPVDVLRWQLADVGCDIDPPVEEMSTACTCPDDVEVCKHVVALLMEVAGIIDADPWVWLAARGLPPTSTVPAAGPVVADPPREEERGREERLQAEREATRRAAVDARLAGFWNGSDTVTVPLSDAPRPAHRERDPQSLVDALTVRFTVRGRSRARAEHLAVLEATALQTLYDDLVPAPEEPPIPRQRGDDARLR